MYDRLHVSGNCFLWPDYVGFCQRNIGCAGKCSCKFFGYDPTAARNAPSNPSPAELAEKTIDYAEAKEAYFKALRAEMPELMKIATVRKSGLLNWTPLLRHSRSLAKTRRRTNSRRFC